MDLLAVTLGGLLAIAAIVWWFWLSSPETVHADDSQSVEIRVEGDTYQPSVVEVPAGKPFALRFLRLDANPCAEKVVFGSLGISADLPLGKPQIISLGSLQPGIYEFTCQMGMYRGRLIAT
jgi:plastocyanin domain-containing protein